MKERVHAALIIEWARGAKIQYRNIMGDWADVDDPAWTDGCEYRVKPSEPDRADYPKLAADDVSRIAEYYCLQVGTIELVSQSTLKAACDNGQIVTRAEFDKVSSELNNMYTALSRPGGLIKIPAVPEHFRPKWREHIKGFGSIDGEKEVVQAIKAEFDRAVGDRKLRDMRVADAVLADLGDIARSTYPTCSTLFSMFEEVCRKVNVAAIIAEVDK